MNDYGVIVAVMAVSGLAALLIAQSRGVSPQWLWFVIGLLFGPLGVAFAWFLAKPPKTGRTPEA